MKSPNYLIVELDRAYDNEVNLSNGDNFIVNSTIENVSHINRVAKVVSAPDYTILKKGDDVVVHHNIFRLRNDVRGNTVPSNFSIGDNRYIVPLTEVFMYRRDKDWIAIDPYCFVEPILAEKEGDFFQMGLSEISYKGWLNHVGIIRYPNQQLLSQGLKEGDRVLFSENSEYEFNIEDRLYYKMSTKDILAVL